MRRIFSEYLAKIVQSDESIIFITGDLGYNALETLQKIMGNRFINAGVAEQNMIGVAAGLAKKGFKVFCYSIAPFAVYRCLEQIRVDVCFHKLPVFIVGNGGGYGYGIMGATHHALEDIACLSSLPNMTCWIPAFAEDVPLVIDTLIKKKSPAYLRLGLGKKNLYNNTAQSISQFTDVVKSKNPKVTIAVLGPLIHNLEKIIQHYKNEIDVFTVLNVPILTLSENFINSIKHSKKLLIIEEHTSRGGIAENISLKILEENITLDKFKSVSALGYPNGLYGSQQYHQTQSHLDSDSLLNTVQNLLNV